ncbi:endophilin-A-like isoform X3 [Panonychus citri]|uniref:endophilin-A-like isoform X3 n=1 Tax=Panonychus citri TaxID=50023 RepID=UPI002307B43B|nr:endophilin-A-like isoform X3 [Panonychus citri]
MALAGLKKQINKANQYMSEKMGAVEGTKFTDDYHEMEKKTDATVELVDEMIVKTKEYLQPNPATRAKLTVTSKVQSAKGHAYNQPEGILGESMIKYGRKMGEESDFGQSLVEMGEALRQMSEVKFALEDNVKQNFLEPLTHLQTKDIRDVLHHRKKLESRRLDFDCKKRKKRSGGHVTEEDIKTAEDKFEESFNCASMGMHNLLQNEPEQISQLVALSEALFEYHSQCASILESLTSRLADQKRISAEQPIKPYVPKKIEEIQLPHHDDLTPGGETPGHTNGSNIFYSHFNNYSAHLKNGKTVTNVNHNTSPLPSPVRSPARTPVSRGPCCQALYDFDAENPRELGFKEGDIITLNQKLDDNWFEGTINGKTGIFPISYVQVLVPIGQQ